MHVPLCVTTETKRTHWKRRLAQVASKWPRHDWIGRHVIKWKGMRTALHCGACQIPVVMPLLEGEDPWQHDDLCSIPNHCRRCHFRQTCAACGRCNILKTKQMRRETSGRSDVTRPNSTVGQQTSDQRTFGLFLVQKLVIHCIFGPFHVRLGFYRGHVPAAQNIGDFFVLLYKRSNISLQVVQAVKSACTTDLCRNRHDSSGRACVIQTGHANTTFKRRISGTRWSMRTG